MYPQAKEIGSKEQPGEINMHGVEKTHQDNPLERHVLSQLADILKEETPAVTANVTAGVRHVSLEEAMRELLEMQRGVEHPPTA